MSIRTVEAGDKDVAPWSIMTFTPHELHACRQGGKLNRNATFMKEDATSEKAIM